MSISESGGKGVLDYLGSMTQLVVEEKVIKLIDDIDRALESFGCPDYSRMVSMKNDRWFNESKAEVLRLIISENPGINLPSWLWVQAQAEILSGLENQLSRNPEPDLNKYSLFIPETYAKLEVKCSLEMESKEVLKLNIAGGVGQLPGCVSGLGIVVSRVEVEGRESPPTFTVGEWRRITEALMQEHFENDKRMREKLKSKLKR
tara:strand:+ start:610 stop:1221 length:612 start_codon:yes stop_codon:yes gene_type:complete